MVGIFPFDRSGTNLRTPWNPSPQAGLPFRGEKLGLGSLSMRFLDLSVGFVSECLCKRIVGPGMCLSSALLSRTLTPHCAPIKEGVSRTEATCSCRCIRCFSPSEEDSVRTGFGTRSGGTGRPRILCFPFGVS